MSDQRVSLPGSEDSFRAGERLSADASPDQQITATILLRRPAKAAASAQDLLSGNYRPPSREAAEELLRADPAEMKAVADFAAQHGLTVTEEPAARRIHIQGTAAQMASAFGVQLKWAEDSTGHRFLTYQGSISIPKQLSEIVTAVLGLSQRTVAQHH